MTDRYEIVAVPPIDWNPPKSQPNWGIVYRLSKRMIGVENAPLEEILPGEETLLMTIHPLCSTGLKRHTRELRERLIYQTNGFRVPLTATGFVVYRYGIGDSENPPTEMHEEKLVLSPGEVVITIDADGKGIWNEIDNGTNLPQIFLVNKELKPERR